MPHVHIIISSSPHHHLAFTSQQAKRSDQVDAVWEKATVTSWDRTACKVGLCFDATDNAAAVDASVSASTVRLNDTMTLVPGQEEDSRRIQRQKLVARLHHLPPISSV